MFCSFRLYGDFVWPPIPDTSKTAPTRQGLVEIWFDRLDPPGAKAGRLRAFLRWRPGNVVGADDDAPPQLPAPEVNIFELPKGWFEEHADAELTVWIHGYDGKKGGEVLAFRGALLFEQLQAQAGTLRWPVIREAALGKSGKTTLSELIIGQPVDPKAKASKDNFRFNLHLPTPWPQHTLAGAGFPFGVIYDSDVANEAAATLYDTLTAGPRGADVTVTDEPQTKRLGAFGFAPVRAGAPDYAGATVGLEPYWPQASATGLYLSLLGAIGIATDTTSGRPKLLRSGPTEMSFRPGFDTTPGSSRNWYVSRLSFAPPSGSGGTGDLCWADGQFYLHLEEELGGYLQLRQLHLDVIVEFAIPDAAIWSGYAAWTAQLKLRPHWQSALAEGPLGKQPTALFRGRPAFSAGTLPDGANAMRAALADLYRVETAQPQSVLPDLSVPFAQQPRFALYAPPVEVGFSATGLVQFAGNPPATQATPLRLSLLDPQHLVAPEQPATLQLRADLPSFFTLAPKPLPLQLDHDAGWVATGSWNDVAAAQSQPYFARFMVRASPEAGNVDKTVSWSGRLASMEFSAHDTVLDYRGSRLSIAGRGLGNRGHYAIPSGTGFAYPVAVQLQLNLPFTGARPVGVDLRRGTNVDRAAPLLIDLDAQAVGTAPKATQFHLKITEYLAPVGDRLLEAEVFDNSGETGERNYVVLSEEPFAINRFSTRVLGARGGADSASVAFYSSERRLWEFRRVAEYYRYSFPAQAVGESADKPRRLEIHDLRDDEAPEGDGGPHRPYLAYPADPQSSLRRRAVEFALTPSAEIWIRPSDVERGYFMPEWNSHEIFRQRGELGLGAALAWLRAEFVYGLPVGIEVGKERGVSRRARVAEIEVLTGLPLGTTDSGTPLADRWNALSNAIARRPERLEVWADNPDSVLDFAPARFSDGASFALRQTALLRAPVLRDGVEPAETAAHYAQLPKSRGGLRYHPQGLSGGAIWPVESANLFDALADSPLATGGEIENIALSPLGGDAAQKALFLGGKVTIITRTRNGYIERQQVEVLGRIGALWHRAKHVVVYERTVNPSAQFAPTQQEDPLRTRSRRPILRKVREYIELLQPERAYPDFAQASARSAGFLDRVRFNAHIINVDSAWGHDIGTDAWEIPLWNRQAARQRPQVYPLPDVAFVSVAEGDGERPVVAQECRDPDNLYFFTDFKAPSADTDLWLQRLGIDYANMPSAGAIAQVHDRRSAQDPGLNGRAERRRPPVSQSLPGLRRFTWRLASAPRKVAINAGRAAKPIYVGLESISFMRAGQAADSGLFAPLAGLLAQSMALSDAVLPEGLGYWGTNSAAAIFPAGAAFSACVSTLRQALEQHRAPDVIAQARDALQASLIILGDEAPAIVKSVAGGITTGLSTWHDAASNIASKSTRNCDQLKTGALTTLRRKAMLVESLLRDWEADIGTLLDAALAGGSKQALLEQLADSAIAAIRPAFEDSAAGVADIGERAEQARAILGYLEAEADATMRRAMERVKQYAATYERDKPWSAARRNTCYSGLETAVAGLAGEVLAGIDEARQRLSMELDELGQQIAGHVGQVLRQIYAEERAALGELGSFRSAVDQVLASARAALDPLAQRLDQVVTLLSTARDTIEHSQASASIRQHALAALDGLAAAASEIRATSAGALLLIDAASAYGELYDERLTATIIELNNRLHGAAAQAVAALEAVQDAADNLAREGQVTAHAAALDVAGQFSATLAAVWSHADRYADLAGEPIDAVASALVEGLLAEGAKLRNALARAGGTLDQVADDISAALSGVQAMLAPAELLKRVVRERVVIPAFKTMLATMPDHFVPGVARSEALTRLADASTEIAERLRKLDASAIAGIGDISAACDLVFEGTSEVFAYLDSIVSDAKGYADQQIVQAQEYLTNLLGSDLTQFDTMLHSLGAVDQTVRALQNDLARSLETASSYGNRVMEAASKLDQGGLMAAPGNILKLYSAATSAPEIAALRADIDRLRANFDELSDIISTTKAKALFDRLGDELKAIGLSVPFDGIGETLQVGALAGLRIVDLCRNFAGLQCDHLLAGCQFPSDLSNAIRLSHDFDARQSRAWVQIDIDVPLPGRQSLFGFGVFQADFVDMRLTGHVRFDAAGESGQITQTGHARIDTALDMVVSGQSMVRFDKLGLNFSRESGVKIEFDPKNVRINPALRFIQDFLSTLFPDEAGALKTIKQDGIPVGLEHEFALPPLSVNFGTSGVSNITIANRFRLLAYPDFVLANRFNLSQPERPFLFSIFIIGGTGYVQVDAEYRPAENDLMVMVEAAAGGSAALAFAFGPFSGQVFITLSVALSFRKLIGKAGGGLSVGVVLVVAGYVDVAGLVSVGIYLMLRLTYRDNGQIDADGTLSVTIRISRFFKITARAHVQYKLRGGRSETTSSVGVTADPQLGAAARKLQQARA